MSRGREDLSIGRRVQSLPGLSVAAYSDSGTPGLERCWVRGLALPDRPE